MGHFDASHSNRLMSVDILPKQGDFVSVRTRQYLVEGAQPSPGEHTLVSLSCLEILEFESCASCTLELIAPCSTPRCQAPTLMLEQEPAWAMFLEEFGLFLNLVVEIECASRQQQYCGLIRERCAKDEE